MVVGVDPAPSLAQPGTFRVASGDAGTLPTDARPVLGPQLATAVVLDTSAAGGRRAAGRHQRRHQPAAPAARRRHATSSSPTAATRRGRCPR